MATGTPPGLDSLGWEQHIDDEAPEERARVLADSIEDNWFDGWFEEDRPWVLRVSGYGQGQSDVKLISDAEIAGASPSTAMCESRWSNDVAPI
jgi:hypothetical protein